MNNCSVMLVLVCAAIAGPATVVASDSGVSDSNAGYIETDETGYADTHGIAYSETDEQRSSYESTIALIATATGGSDTEARLVATKALWLRAADSEFTEVDTVNVLVQLAYDDDPAVRRVAQRALEDMEKYQGMR